MAKGGVGIMYYFVFVLIVPHLRLAEVAWRKDLAQRFINFSTFDAHVVSGSGDPLAHRGSCIRDPAVARSKTKSYRIACFASRYEVHIVVSV